MRKLRLATRAELGLFRRGFTECRAVSKGPHSRRRVPLSQERSGFIEQKSGAVVRRMVRYRRGGPESAFFCSQLYRSTRVFVSFSQPRLKLWHSKQARSCLGKAHTNRCELTEPGPTLRRLPYRSGGGPGGRGSATSRSERGGRRGPSGALPESPSPRLGNGGVAPIALEALRRFDALFDIERAINGRGADERPAARKEINQLHTLALGRPPASSTMARSA